MLKDAAEVWTTATFFRTPTRLDASYSGVLHWFPAHWIDSAATGKPLARFGIKPALASQTMVIASQRDIILDTLTPAYATQFRCPRYFFVMKRSDKIGRDFPIVIPQISNIGIRVRESQQAASESTITKRGPQKCKFQALFQYGAVCASALCHPGSQAKVGAWTSFYGVSSPLKDTNGMSILEATLPSLSSPAIQSSLHLRLSCPDAPPQNRYSRPRPVGFARCLRSNAFIT
ncbi:hypothetical protein QBC45DRAFT_63872 [Copromyces sp. CBS 386.78]|nr:hypothetical protein QBC45DRAFT_63872 [Copromyces sp. CBS 386.78]